MDCSFGLYMTSRRWCLVLVDVGGVVLITLEGWPRASFLQRAPAGCCIRRDIESFRLHRRPVRIQRSWAKA